MKSFNNESPIFIALCGRAGVGKTTVAERLIPPFDEHSLSDFPPRVWTHTSFAYPIYMMAQAKTDIEGDFKKDRILYSIHEIVSDLMARHCSFDDMIELVYDIYSMPIAKKGEKPRSFLQDVGDLCRNLYPDCFSDYLKRKALQSYRIMSKDYYAEDLDPPHHFVIASDLRMPNEAKMIKDQPNHLLIKLYADDDVVKERLMDREGKLLDEKQKAHNSENSFDDIPSEWFDATIDTTHKTVVEVALDILTLLSNR